MAMAGPFGSAIFVRTGCGKFVPAGVANWAASVEFLHASKGVTKHSKPFAELQNASGFGPIRWGERRGRVDRLMPFPECIVAANKCGLREDFLIDMPFTLR